MYKNKLGIGHLLSFPVSEWNVLTFNFAALSLASAESAVSSYLSLAVRRMFHYSKSCVVSVLELYLTALFLSKDNIIVWADLPQDRNHVWFLGNLMPFPQLTSQLNILKPKVFLNLMNENL